MDVLINILVVVIGYILPLVIAWRLTRETYQKVWTNLKPGLMDVFIVICPIGNILLCISYIFFINSKTSSKTLCEKFFKL